MIGTIQRHLLEDVLRIFAVTLLTFVAIFTLVGVAKEMHRFGIPMDLTPVLIPIVAVDMLHLVIPACFLFAVSATLGRFAATNQLNAVHAAGTSTLRLVRPLLLLAFVMSLLTYVSCELSAAWAKPALQRVLVSNLDRIARSSLSQQQSTQIGSIHVTAQRVQNDLLIRPVLVFGTTTSESNSVLSAECARIESFEGEIAVTSLNTRYEFQDMGQVTIPGWSTYAIPIQDITTRNHFTSAPQELPGSVIHQQIDYERSIVEQTSEVIQSGIATLKNQNTEHDALHPDQISSLQKGLAAHRLRLNRLESENARRLSAGFTCMSFAILGIPIAVWRRSSDYVSTFFFCFMPILVIFYPLLMIGDALTRAGGTYPIGVWLANTCLSVLGLLLNRFLRC